MRLPPFAYHAPDTLDKALKIKGELGASAPILAGGTDLLVNLKHRLASPAAVISLKKIRRMRGVELKADSLVLRAGTPLRDVAAHDAVIRNFPLLVKAVHSIGAVGIQHFRGTIGGNLCLTPRCLFYNQSLFWRTGKGQCHRTGGKDCLALKGSESCQAICAGDTVPVLAALSAQLTIASTGGIRTAPIADFFTGKGESPFNMTPEEILTEIRIPMPWGPLSSSYQRLSFRSAVDFPLINAAAAAILDKGKIESFRLVISSAGPAPVILKEIEAAIKGQQPDPALLQPVREAAVKAVEGVIIENASASKEYRVKLAAVAAVRAAGEALGLEEQPR
jgi:4-hydroxybenzoyl-CoA reductase subunit beta